MRSIYVISRASKIDGEFQCEGVLIRDTYEDAIIAAQNSISDNFDYVDWNDYLSINDPEITEENGVYTIYDDDCCGHEEYYRIERCVIE